MRVMTTQQLGTKLTNISGYLGAAGASTRPMWDKPKESPYPDHAFQIRLVDDDGKGAFSGVLLF